MSTCFPYWERMQWGKVLLEENLLITELKMMESSTKFLRLELDQNQQQVKQTNGANIKSISIRLQCCILRILNTQVTMTMTMEVTLLALLYLISPIWIWCLKDFQTSLRILNRYLYSHPLKDNSLMLEREISQYKFRLVISGLKRILLKWWNLTDRKD